MKKSSFEHIVSPNEIPNSLSEETERNDNQRTNSLREFSLQNKDLTARLSVQLRRNAELEAHINKLGDKIKSIKDQNEEISNNSLKNRKLAIFHQEELDKQSQILRQTEIDLGQTNQLYRDLKISHEQGLSKTARQVKRLERYRSRIQNYIRPRLNQLIEQNFSLLSQFRDLQIKESAHKDQLEVTKYVLDREKNKNQSKMKQAADLQDEIISTYELEIKSVQSLLDQRDIELSEAESKRRYLESLRDKYVVMENKAIAADRVRFEIERKYDKKISELRSIIIEQKDSHKSEKENFEAQKKMLDILQMENEELTHKYLKSATQASTSRGENQASFVKFSQVKTANTKLEKNLEQETSKTQSLKKENQDLRAELRQAKVKPVVPGAMPKELEIFTDINAITPKNELEVTETLNSENLKNNLELSNLDFSEINEIDRLIKEIETGFPIKTMDQN